MTTKELMKTALATHEIKETATRDMHDIAADTAKNIADHRITKQTVLRIKDYMFYRGRGWANETDPIKREPKGEDRSIEKFPDRVSPCFRRLATIVTDLRSADMLDTLDVYLEALKEYGITISIDEETFGLNDNQREGLKSAIDTLSTYQATICNAADELKDELGEIAETINFSPKNKFKELVSFNFRKLNGKDVDDKLHDKILATELYENGLTSIRTGDLSPE